MKKIILLTCFLAGTMIHSAQETVNLSMGAGYANEIYYKLATNSENTYESNSWDVAFLRNNSQNIAIRINDGKGIQVFEAANNPNDFNTINVANEAAWTTLYNDATNWDNGAFMQGSATYGWGEYNPATHHVEGTIVYVLKYADGTYRKFINEDYFGGYTFKYATWDGTNWVNETTYTLDNDNNPDNHYNYYSLEENQEVIAEPATSDWDFVFRKYDTFLDPPGQHYVVTGTLHNPNVTVAQNEEISGGGPNGLLYSEEINTIGHDWKSFNGSSYVVNSDMAYYVKTDEITIYRVVFTAFEGSSSGNISFQYEDVSALLGSANLYDGISFGMYPNPAQDKKVAFVYDIKNSTANNTVNIFDLNGRKVFETSISQNEGFYNKTIDLSGLKTGTYLVTLVNGNNSITKKLILN